MFFFSCHVVASPTLDVVTKRFARKKRRRRENRKKREKARQVLKVNKSFNDRKSSNITLLTTSLRLNRKFLLIYDAFTTS